MKDLNLCMGLVVVVGVFIGVNLPYPEKQTRRFEMRGPNTILVETCEAIAACEINFTLATTEVLPR